jgi:hypothetical protein
VEAVDDVERSVVNLIWAAERVQQAIDVVGDDTVACRHVSFKVPLELELLARRIGTAQALDAELR